MNVIKLKTTELPDKPSELLRVALADLKVLEQTPGFDVDMDNWVRVFDPEYPKHGQCTVCLAGAALVRTCGLNLGDVEGYVHLSELEDGRLADKLTAINQFRVRHVLTGLILMQVPERSDQRVREEFDSDTKLPPYGKDNGWHEAMQDLVRRLESFGL